MYQGFRDCKRSSPIGDGEPGKSGGHRHNSSGPVGRLAQLPATGTRWPALAETFPIAQQYLQEGQSRWGSFQFPVAVGLGLSPGLFLAPCGRHMQACLGRGLSQYFVIGIKKPALVWGWGETARADRPPAHHSTKVPCFCGSQCFLHKYSPSKLKSLPSLQTISLQPATVLSTGLLSNPHIPAHSTSCTVAGIYPRLGCAGLWNGPSVQVPLYPVHNRHAVSLFSDSCRCSPSVPIDVPII